LSNGVAEFGIIVEGRWQRRGVCRETFLSNKDYAATLGFTTITAATLEVNQAMLAFLSKMGFAMIGSEIHNDLKWIEFALQIA